MGIVIEPIDVSYLKMLGYKVKMIPWRRKLFKDTLWMIANGYKPIPRYYIVK